MDLLERGRSLSELGKTLRWTDIEALLLHLPSTSHVRRKIAPEAARAAEWTTPTAQLLGAIYDHVERTELERRGVPEEHLPDTVISRVLTADAQPQQEEDDASAPNKGKKQVTTVADRDKTAREAAARIRAEMK